MKTRLTLGYNTEHDTDTQENDVDDIPGTKSIFNCYNLPNYRILLANQLNKSEKRDMREMKIFTNNFVIAVTNSLNYKGKLLVIFARNWIERKQ